VASGHDGVPEHRLGGGGSLPSFVPTAFLYIERSCARIMRQYNQSTIFTFIDPYIPTILYLPPISTVVLIPQIKCDPLPHVSSIRCTFPVPRVLTISRSTLIFSQRLIRDCPDYQHHPQRHPHRRCRVVLYNFPLSGTWRAALTISRSTSIFSPRLIRDCPDYRHHPHRHPHRHHTHRVVLYNIPLSVTGRAALTI